MSHPTPAPRRVRCAWGMLLLLALALGTPAAQADSPFVPPAQARAEIGLPAPLRYAIILQEPGQVRMLVAAGQVLFHPQDRTRAWTVERVEAGAVIVRDGPRGRPQTLPVGRALPGFPGWTVSGTVLLDQLHYRYKLVDRILHQDPVLVALAGSRAVLDVEVLRPRSPAGRDPAGLMPPPDGQPFPSPRTTLDGDLLEKVRVREVSPNLYDVNAQDVQAVLENAGRVLADLWPTVQPSLSLQTGLQYRITSAMSDGVLTGQGFTVTAPKLAERAGLQVGDTILSVNGQPVNGFASLYGIIREVRGNPALSTVQVELDRRGTRLTKIFRIR